AKIARQNPALIEAIPEDEINRAQAVAEYASLGLPAARAVELAAQRAPAGGMDTARGAATAADETPLDLSGQIGSSRSDRQAETDAVQPGQEADEATETTEETQEPVLIAVSDDGDRVSLVDPATGERKELSAERLSRVSETVDRLDASDLAASDDDTLGGLLTPEEREELQGLLLDLTSVIGELRSLRDGVLAFKAAREALDRGDLSEAGIMAAFGALGIAGGASLGGQVVRIGKASVKGAQVLARVFRRIARTRSSRLAATPSMTPNQIQRFGKASEAQRLARIKPLNRFKGADAFAKLTPEKAFAATRFPPAGAEENVFRGLAAMDVLIKDVLRKGKGVVPDAMHRADLPAGQKGITFRWGTPGQGKDFKGGSGISHIIAKHGVEVLEDVAATITHGEKRLVKIGSKKRLEITNGDNRATLALDRFGNQETWVLTGFKKGNTDRHFDLSRVNGPVFFKGREKK
ncbi:MAG: hypothetical protein RIB59_04965, partial [Rhodospirillales bacterium]